jgi:hypothetical protein
LGHMYLYMCVYVFINKKIFSQRKIVLIRQVTP